MALALVQLRVAFEAHAMDSDTSPHRSTKSVFPTPLTSMGTNTRRSLGIEMVPVFERQRISEGGSALQAVKQSTDAVDLSPADVKRLVAALVGHQIGLRPLACQGEHISPQGRSTNQVPGQAIGRSGRRILAHRIGNVGINVRDEAC